MKYYIAAIAFGIGVFSYAQHGPHHHPKPPHGKFVKHDYHKGPRKHKHYDRRHSPREINHHHRPAPRPHNRGIYVVIK